MGKLNHKKSNVRKNARIKHRAQKSQKKPGQPPYVRTYVGELMRRLSMTYCMEVWLDEDQQILDRRYSRCFKPELVIPSTQRPYVHPDSTDTYRRVYAYGDQMESLIDYYEYHAEKKRAPEHDETIELEQTDQGDTNG